MADHMRAKSFYAFRRQLSLYGFKREGKHCSQPCFSHPFFVKGREELLKDIVRQKQYKTKSKLSLDITMLNACQSQFQRVYTTEDGEKHRTKVVELFKFIKGLEKYIGIGLPFFLKELTSHLKNTFSDVATSLNKEFTDASATLNQTQFIKEEDMVNKKELTVGLVNRILAEVYGELLKKEVSPVYLAFNNDLDELDDNSPTLWRTGSIRSLKKPPSKEHQPSKLLPGNQRIFFSNSPTEPCLSLHPNEETLSQLDFELV